MWVEILLIFYSVRVISSHPLREDVSWNTYTVIFSCDRVMSSSSWGCELKWAVQFCLSYSSAGHPLREDVSWNVLSLHTLLRANRHPLREDVSWNTTDTVATETLTSHPLREDVSWNVSFLGSSSSSSPSSSSWGCELKYHTCINSFLQRFVILFVRMWVEMIIVAPTKLPLSSSSSWGCELK